MALFARAFAGLSAGPLAAANFVLGTAAIDASDRIIYDAGTGGVWFDADGNGAGAAQLFALVTVGTAITAADFVIL
jgi:Ca2+-binding RTX toxin-like protein